MYFNFLSLLSAAVPVLPLTALGAPAASDIEDRSEKTHKVTVGVYDKLPYSPQYVYAKVGDYVKFEFHPKNHTVTESSFDYPCMGLTGNEGEPVGFRTGFVPVPAGQRSHFPTRKFKVTDVSQTLFGDTRAALNVFMMLWRRPHWFYCGQDGHCPSRMVFAVNPPKFQKMAMEYED